MKVIHKISLSFALVFALVFALSSCKVEDPWVDASVAPVLVDIVGAPFGYPQEKDPTVGYASSATKLVIAAKLLELDKTNILNNEIGIDSIPVSGLKILVSLRDGGALGEVTSNDQGLISLEKTWAELGVATPVAGKLVKVSWSGTYKGIAFTRLSQIKAL